MPQWMQVSSSIAVRESSFETITALARATCSSGDSDEPPWWGRSLTFFSNAVTGIDALIELMRELPGD